jgi:hypothetical protein
MFEFGCSRSLVVIVGKRSTNRHSHDASFFGIFNVITSSAGQFDPVHDHSYPRCVPSIPNRLGQCRDQNALRVEFMYQKVPDSEATVISREICTEAQVDFLAQSEQAREKLGHERYAAQ